MGAAALVPLTVDVAPGPSSGAAGPAKSSRSTHADGYLNGRSSWARIVVDQRWLADVWGAGAAVVGGELVLSIDYGRDQPTAKVVRWDTAGGGYVARVADVGLSFDPIQGWRPDLLEPFCRM